MHILWQFVHLIAALLSYLKKIKRAAFYIQQIMDDESDNVMLSLLRNVSSRIFRLEEKIDGTARVSTY